MKDRTRISAAAAAALTMFGVCGAGAALSAQPVPPRPGMEARTIRVSGVGEYRVQPDLATVQFAVETTGATAREAADANAERMERVIAALVAAGVPRSEIQTSGYNLYPEYRQEPRPGAELESPRIVGYRAMNQVSVRSREIARVGALIDAGLAAGANRLHGVSFGIENSDAAEAEALSRAVGEARRAAETMARALGVELGPILDASTAAEPIQPYFRGRMQDVVMAEAAAMTPIEPGEQTVRATASLVYEIR